MAPRSPRSGGDSTRVTVGAEPKSTGVPQEGQYNDPSGSSRAHEEHFIRTFPNKSLACPLAPPRDYSKTNMQYIRGVADSIPDYFSVIQNLSRL